MTAREFLDRPMTEWCATSDLLTREEVRGIETQAARLATEAARLSAYLSRLMMNGGDHEGAVKRQDQVASKVRRALGFSYPDDAITF